MATIVTERIPEHSPIKLKFRPKHIPEDAFGIHRCICGVEFEVQKEKDAEEILAHLERKHTLWFFIRCPACFRLPVIAHGKISHDDKLVLDALIADCERRDKERNEDFRLKLIRWAEEDKKKNPAVPRPCPA